MTTDNKVDIDLRFYIHHVYSGNYFTVHFLHPSGLGVYSLCGRGRDMKEEEIETGDWRKNKPYVCLTCRKKAKRLGLIDEL